MQHPSIYYIQEFGFADNVLFMNQRKVATLIPHHTRHNYYDGADFRHLHSCGSCQILCRVLRGRAAYQARARQRHIPS